MNREEIRAKYGELEETYEKLRVKENKRLLLLSFSRLLVFIGGIALGIAGFSTSALLGIVAVFVSVTIFLVLIKLYSEHSDLRNYYSNLVKINGDEIRSLSGDYTLFRDGSEWLDPDHDFSNDIDLFGRDSLFQYLNRTVTGYGRRILAGWLSEPFTCASELNERQEAIRELSGKLSWRQEFTARGLNRSLGEEDIGGLLEWLNQGTYIYSSLLFQVLIYIFPAMTVITMVLSAAGLLSYSFFTGFFLLNLLITFSFLKKTNRIHTVVSKKHNYLASFTGLLLSFKNESFNSAILSLVKKEMTGDADSSINSIRALSRIVRYFDSRLNIFVGFILNGLLLWDLHCINSLEKWRRKSSGLLPVLLENIGRVDAYNSLANYAFNNPDFTWPSISDSGIFFKATQIGHPLLPAERRICNDFTISEKGKITIITGANMAGKSTFLRTVAVNFILAMAGVPVCAAGMIFKPVNLFTSMRTTDSLSHNESYFYAELRRLKVLREKLEAGGQVLFILDEILKGTNSADKSRGSKLFIKKCIELGGTGLIATHDTTLADTEKDHPGIILNRCFEIEIKGDKVSFDYKLRDGITTRMNASILMREMGITD